MTRAGRSIRGRVRVLAVLAAVLAVSPVAACGSGDAGGAGPAGHGPSVASEPGPPGSEDPSATASGSDGVEPASGPWVGWPQVRIRAPEGWRTKRQFAVKTAQRPDGPDLLMVAATPAIDGLEPTRATLRRLAREVLRLDYYDGEPDVELDASMAGRPAYRITGSTPLGDGISYGTVHDDHIIDVTFQLHRTPEGERDELVESVLATLEYR